MRVGLRRSGLLIALLIGWCTPVLAHDTLLVGGFRLIIGWGDEPAFAGSRNAITIVLADSKGAPVTDLGGGSLTVEVLFGSERILLPLQPSWERRNEFRAWIVPTRAGAYSFHFSGTIRGQAIDARSSCSNKTFDCVRDPSEIQFPVKDPPPGQLAERIDRSLPRADRAEEAAARARTIAFAALGVAALALGLSFTRIGRKDNRTR